MKKIFKAIMLAGLSLTLGSCMSNLEIPQKSVLSTEDYYKNATAEEAEALIASVYKLYWGGRDVTCVNGIEKILFLNSLDDDHYTGGGSFADATNQYQAAGDYNVTSNDFAMKIVYKGIYSVIFHCNLILEKIPETTDPAINRVKAEANFLRALAMFDAVRWWGTPPLVDHILTPGEYYMSNTPTDVTIKWVLERMKEAADALPAISGKGQQQAFGARISKHAALAYRGKVGLWYGQKFNDSAVIAEAVEDLKAVVNSGLYGLVQDMFVIERPSGDWCEEYLFEHNAAEEDGYPGDPQSDLRVKSTIHTYDQVVAMEYAEGVTPGAISSGICHNAGYFTFRGVAFAEDCYDVPPPFWKWSSANNPMLRYAEVLLLYAEAKFLKDGDADGTGLKALNEVRRRAQIPELSSMTYQDIKDERRAELFTEQERYFDLVRWGDAATALKDKGKVYYQFFGYKPGTTEWDVREVQGKGNGWQPKYELLPFPYEQIAANPNLEQNPSW